MEGKTFERELPKGYKLGDVIEAYVMEEIARD